MEKNTKDIRILAIETSCDETAAAVVQNGREVLIAQIGLVHPKYDGLKTTYAFDLTDGATDYRITLDTDSLNWYLEFEGDHYE